MCLSELLSRAAAENSQKAALICGDRTVSFEELDQSVTRLARWLLQEGLQPGDRVGIHWYNEVRRSNSIWPASARA